MIKMNYQKVTEHTLAVTSEDFIAGAIALNNFIIIIDSTLFPYTGKIMRNYIEKFFRLPVRFLYLTHYHGDHLWGISAFNGVEILASDQLIENVANEKPIQSARFEEWKKKDPEKTKLIDAIDTTFSVNITFTNLMKIHDEDIFVELKHCGGHTSCSSYAYFPQERVLVAGDLIFAKEWPWAGDPTCNPNDWINGFEEIMKLDIEFVIPGHGPIVTKDEVEVHLNFFKSLREEANIAHKNGEEMRIPPFYDDTTPGEWVKNETLKFIYKFYRNQFLE
ncbi:MAG: MBL fold metallo-hydrolase [Candidatus Heimdallarchaeota archaeon]|nr:MAG: MBL fold metallo-hydrolase [Candidatus Heimdallarchaeota archaeon]